MWANGQDVVVFAPRRYGKSPLLWRVAQELVKEGVLVAQVDLIRTPTKDQLAAKLAKTIHEELATRLWAAKERLKVFGGLRLQPTITIDPNDGAVSFSFDARAAERDIDATLEELLIMLGKIAADRALMKLMRSVFQEQPEVAHIYLGSKRHMMRRIFNDENEPFWRSATWSGSGAPTSPPTGAGTATTGTSRRSAAISTSSIWRTSPSSSRTGAGRSGCAGRSSTPTGWRAWCC
jgi:uncharacterized protein